MKKNILMILGMLGLGVAAAHAQIIIDSWESTADIAQWTILEPSAWTSLGLSTTGVTAGSYSWGLSASAVDYNPALQGPASTALTTAMLNAASVSLDLDLAGDHFSWGIQIDLEITQPGGANGGNPIDLTSGDYLGDYSGLGEATITWPVPPSTIAALSVHPTLPTYFTFRIGGGGDGIMYIDNLRVTPIGLLSSWESTAEIASWTILEPTAWTSLGLSTNGVTSGSYSWGLSASAVDYNPALQGPSSTALTAAIANSSAVSLDLDLAGYHFSWGIQIDLEITQPGGANGGNPIDFTSGDYLGDYSGLGEATITWPVPQSARTALDAYPSLPSYLTFRIGGGGDGIMYIDNLRATVLPPAPAQLAVRELWDDIAAEQNPTAASITDNTSSLGFVSASPWVPNPAESGLNGTVNNTGLMEFRPGFYFEELSLDMGLPGSLDGTGGCMVQENGGGGFYLPATGGGSFWTSGDWMTRPLAPNNYINFKAVGEYWFSMSVQEFLVGFTIRYIPLFGRLWLRFFRRPHHQRRLCRGWADAPPSLPRPG